jgi:hypothetical protein
VLHLMKSIAKCRNIKAKAKSFGVITARRGRRALRLKIQGVYHEKIIGDSCNRSACYDLVGLRLGRGSRRNSPTATRGGAAPDRDCRYHRADHGTPDRASAFFAAFKRRRHDRLRDSPPGNARLPQQELQRSQQSVCGMRLVRHLRRSRGESAVSDVQSRGRLLHLSDLWLGVLQQHRRPLCGMRLVRRV